RCAAGPDITTWVMVFRCEVLEWTAQRRPGRALPLAAQGTLSPSHMFDPNGPSFRSGLQPDLFL
ncbi:MAG: hypothetical protein ACRENP_05315, partial [Longimicrobiales bacterium]